MDAVLYFEGDRQMTYRILRAVKNRYGSTNEIGVFDMGDHGLKQVENPSQAMLSGRPKDASGTCVTAVMEGTRPLLAEIQGLATTSGFGTPRRMATGFDYNRMALILACWKSGPGTTSPTWTPTSTWWGACGWTSPPWTWPWRGLISSLKDKPVREDTVVFGRLASPGELRSVSHSDLRIAEAARLGFTRCVVPYHGPEETSPPPNVRGWRSSAPGTSGTPSRPPPDPVRSFCSIRNFVRFVGFFPSPAKHSNSLSSSRAGHAGQGPAETPGEQGTKPAPGAQPPSDFRSRHHTGDFPG